MRHIIIRLLSAGTLLLTGVSRAAEETPYEAVVLDQGAEVRAGPGLRFYVTQQLEPGTQVEVHRREAADWLAIRPPEGSFSWIPESDLEMTEEPGIAEVIAEEAKSWLGSRAERIREHKSHVVLARGERVEVLGKKQVAGEDGKTQLWLKIAPPAGEFRWVHSRQVRKAKGRELASAKDKLLPVPERKKRAEVVAVAAEEPAEESDEQSEALTKERPSPRRSLIMLSDLREEQPEVYPERQVAHEEPVAEKSRSLSPDGFVPRRRHPSATSPETPRSAPRLASAPGKGAPSAARSEAPATLPSTALASDDVSRQLEELDLQLSLLLARDKSTWNFSPIKERVERIVESASTPADRGQARFMLDKIKRFEEAFDVQSLPGSPTPAPVAAKDFRAYDGEGWLTAVKSTETPVAPYALVDRDGKRICFVSPAPGLSVSSHVNKRVGLYGKRGMIPDLNVPHVLANKVIDLDRLR